MVCHRKILAVWFRGCLSWKQLLRRRCIMMDKHKAYVQRLLGKEDDICTRCAYAATSLTNLGDKVWELRRIPNLGSNMCFVL